MEHARDRRAPIVRGLIAFSASLALMVTAVAAVATVQWVQLRDRGVEGGEFTGPVGPSTSPSGSPSRCSQSPCNYLLLGSDSRAGLGTDRFGTNEDIGGARADTIMLVHTDPELQKAIVLSFPRDLWVKIDGGGFDRINTAFEGGLRHGGPRRMAQTVANLTGLVIDHYLYVDLDGFRTVVDTIGGVDMCVPAYQVNTPGWLPANDLDGNPIRVYVGEEGRIADPNAGLNIAPGCQRLEGEQALAYVRARHLPCDDIPDFSRIGRQQQFLRALVNQMLEPSMIVRAPSLVPQVLEGLRRDAGLLPSELVYLVGQLRGLGTGAVEFRAVPGESAFVGEKSVVKMDPSADRLFAAIREGRPIGTVGTQLVDTPPSEANIPVAVVDQRSEGAASEVESILADAGFDISPGIRVATDRDVPGPAIVFAEGAEASARVVGAYFPNVPVIGPKPITGADVSIVVPRSYRPVTPTEQGEATCPAIDA
jgi:anionic cell wall polymer biosynthesis LytR-Cps2A-Psr (LCP) family protein